MSRDYAKVQASSRAKENKESNSVVPVLAILFVAGLCFAGGYWLGGKQMKPESGKVSQADLDRAEQQLEKKDAAASLLQARIDELEEQVTMWKDKAGAGAHTKVGELQFYKELPKQSVTPAPVADSEPAPARAMDKPLEIDAPKPVAAAQTADSAESDSSGSYRIQLASFQNREDAAKVQHKLMQAGFTAFIHTVNLPNRGQWFRVYAGPFSDKEKARAMVDDIQEKLKIRGLLVSDG